MMEATGAGVGEETGVDNPLRDNRFRDNPFRDGGPAERAMPWLSAAVVLVLAVATLAGGAGPLVKAVAATAAVAVIGRSAYLVNRRRPPHR
jgi:hypothetical protein